MRHLLSHSNTTELSLFLPVVVLAAPPLVLQDDVWDGLDDVRVPVTLGVMSQCPDALLCEAVFDQVLSSREVMGIVDLQLTYIGQLDSSEPDFGVECIHGPDEARFYGITIVCVLTDGRSLVRGKCATTMRG